MALGFNRNGALNRQFLASDVRRVGSDHTRPLFYFAMALGFNRNGALNRQFLASDRFAKLHRAPPSCSISNQPLEAYF